MNAMFTNMVLELIWYPPWRIFFAAFSRENPIFSSPLFLLSFTLLFPCSKRKSQIQFLWVRIQFLFLICSSITSYIYHLNISNLFPCSINIVWFVILSQFHVHLSPLRALFLLLWFNFGFNVIFNSHFLLEIPCYRNFPQFLGFCKFNSDSQFLFYFSFEKDNSIVCSLIEHRFISNLFDFEFTLMIDPVFSFEFLINRIRLRLSEFCISQLSISLQFCFHHFR